MSGKLLQKTILDNSELFKSDWLQLLLVFSAGILTVWFHEVLRWPLSLPGRHGLELMAILMFVRLSSKLSFAASLAAVGGMSASLLLHDSGAVAAIILLFQGIAIDLGYLVLKRQRLILILMVLVTACAHMLKPLIKFVFQTGLNIYSDSLNHGLVFPMISHFSFGLIGGLVGFIAWWAMRKKQQTNS